MPGHFEILDKTLGYDGYFKIVKYRYRHGLFAGGDSDALDRECFERGHAVGVLPYDAELDAVLLVEQFRVGALEAPRGPWLIEIIAGMLEPGEAPEDVAYREAIEEANCRPGDLIPICRYLPSPGGSSEQVSVYAAAMSLENMGGIHGNADEGEDIRVHVVPFEQAMEMVEDGTIHAAMPIIALQWLALNRDRLRDTWSL